MHTLCRLVLLPQHTFPIIPASIVLLLGELRLQLVLCVQSVQRSKHFLLGFLTGGGHRTARMASSNTVLRPRCVKAEHSRYFTAPVVNTKEYLKWIHTLNRLVNLGCFSRTKHFEFPWLLIAVWMK